MRTFSVMKLDDLGLGMRLFAAALVAAGVVLACSSDSTDGTSTPGQDTGPGTDSAAADSAAADAATAVDAADAADAAVLPTSIPAGKYAITVWTCGAGGSSKDIKAFAATIGIQGVNQTFSGMTAVFECERARRRSRATAASARG